MLRIGNGIDFHRLEVNPERPFILGGYIIPTELALVGHSDADILIHAISDALLGALSLGDIGQYFPDTDPTLKNMDSRDILRKVVSMVNEKNYRIENIDSTILCERPKISPHREEIRKSLAGFLHLDPDAISVKATTTEKMGALGRKEGVGVFSTVLLVKIIS